MLLNYLRTVVRTPWARPTFSLIAIVPPDEQPVRVLGFSTVQQVLRVQMRENPVNRILEDVARVVGGIAALAVPISRLGLLGIARHTAKTCRKAIGVRKVAGASRWSLALLRTHDVLRVVVLAGFVTFPLAWPAGRLRLQLFASRVEVGPTLLAAWGLGLVGLVLLVVSTHTIRTGRSAPVQLLRTK